MDYNDSLFFMNDRMQIGKISNKYIQKYNPNDKLAILNNLYNLTKLTLIANEITDKYDHKALETIAVTDEGDVRLIGFREPGQPFIPKYLKQYEKITENGTKIYNEAQKVFKKGKKVYATHAKLVLIASAFSDKEIKILESSGVPCELFVWLAVDAAEDKKIIIFRKIYDTDQKEKTA